MGKASTDVDRRRLLSRSQRPLASSPPADTVKLPDTSLRSRRLRAAEDQSGSKVQLLPQDALIKTGPFDHADWNHKPVLGWIQRQRFKLALSLLPESRSARLLEIGYGSGVFLPALSQRCEELYGIDIHDRNQEIGAELVKRGVFAQLRVGTAEALPFDNGRFDCVVAVSSLEFVGDVLAGCGEIARVLKPDGSLVVITPGRSRVVDLGLRLLTGESAKKDYGEKRESLMGAVEERFQVMEERLFPSIAGRVFCLYAALRLRPRAVDFADRIVPVPPLSHLLPAELQTA
jgi:SAM-dependent methyltransferase